MGLKCLFGHNWISVDAFTVAGLRKCSMCSIDHGDWFGVRCAHSFSVCMKCGQARGYGSHGSLSVIPDSCKAQIREMRMGVDYKGKEDQIG